jgi:hypothetical protein
MATNTTKTAKAVNYTPEQTATVVSAYVAAPTKETVEALASSMGKTARSIIAKLSREGVYKAKEYTTKTGAAPIKKDEHATKIAELVGLSDGEADSLTKANKTALVKIVSHMVAMQATIDEEFDVEEIDE